MESLGIDPKLLIAQVVNFLILLLVLRKFLYRPVLNMLEERKSKIEKGLLDSETAKKQLDEAEDKAARILKEADDEAKRIREEAKREALKAHDKVMQTANEKAAKVLENAKLEADSMKENALKSAKKELSGVLTLAMDKVLKNDLTETEKESLTASAIKEL